MNITESEGYKKLLAAVESDEAKGWKSHDYRGKLAWVVERAQNYAENAGLEASDILDAWEKDRTYWYMNYYQDCNQPKLEGKARVFDTLDDLQAAVKVGLGFRCPRCGGVSKSPYECDSGLEMEKGKRGKPGKICDWKVYGLFGDMGKGVYVFVKSELRGQKIFLPVAWEEKANE